MAFPWRRAAGIEIAIENSEPASQTGGIDTADPDHDAGLPIKSIGRRVVGDLPSVEPFGGIGVGVGRHRVTGRGDRLADRLGVSTGTDQKQVHLEAPGTVPPRHRANAAITRR